MRSIDLERNTKETQIKLSLNLDGSGSADLSVELPFFAHMPVSYTHLTLPTIFAV